MSNITPREQTAILNSLSTGLVPQIGLHHLAVGRKPELQTLSGDLESIKQGGSAFRIVTGPIGAGKTFVTHLLRGIALENRVVVLSADLGVNHRLHATDSRGRALISSLMANVCTKANPTGKGLPPLMESWISGLGFDLGDQNGTPEAMKERIFNALRPLKDYPGGFEFAQVIVQYYEGHVNDNPALQDAALRWLRAEYSTKTEARQDLGVRRIIGDEDVYASLKLFSAFCKLAGYQGVWVMLDELSALTYRLPHARARQANVQVLLTIINDCIQGGASGLGFLLAGTPDTLSDADRGLFTIPALRSRLQDCAPRGCVDYASPVLQLEPLGKEDLFVLLRNIRRVHASGDESKYRLPDEAIERFLMRALSRFGRMALANPRDVLRRFVSILNILEQEPKRPWPELIEVAVAETGQDSDPAEAELAALKLA